MSACDWDHYYVSAYTRLRDVSVNGGSTITLGLHQRRYFWIIVNESVFMEAI